MSKATAIGIDLGTTTTCIAVVDDGTPKAIPNLWGDRVHASVVAFLGDDKVQVGNEAKKQVILNPENTVYSVKRIIGRHFYSQEVKKAQSVVPYEIVEGPNSAALVRVQGEDRTVQEVSSYILREAKKIAEEYLGRAVDHAVITVPAHFNDNQRQATRDAGKIAGLDILRMINEPTAAALSYGYGRDLTQRVAIYDLGGGTFDISILEIGGDIYEVLGTAGDSYLGGDDFDLRLMNHLAERFFNESGVNLKRNKFSLQKLKEACEQAKKDITLTEEVLVQIPEIFSDDLGSLDLEYEINREEYNNLVMDLVQKTFKVCDEALYAARCSVHDLDGVILVGGPTRLQIIRESVGYYFGKEADTSIDPDEVVGMGAAIHADSLMATSRQETAAYLLDVTPMSLQVGTVGGYTEVLIERNTPVPIEQSRVFTTARDNQDKVRIKVYQGESNRVEENVLLGQFEFAGFRIAPRGEVQIEVLFEIDASGIVNVSAKDMETGHKQSMTIKLSSGLTDEDIEEGKERGDHMVLV